MTSPASAYRVDTRTGEVETLADLVPAADGGVPEPAISVQRRRATSADGTEVPYFLITPDGWSGTGPTLLWGYGGFKIPIFADYRPGWTGWLAAGGALVVANLRGGGEFGTDWYHAGRLANKQNVFDDAIAVAEDLITTGVTTSDQLAVHGRSNGGLLVGAMITQRPDLFAAAVPGVGVLDLLRFHLFTVGAAWKSDYGDPDDARDFGVALDYSPLHKITEGASYPPTLVLTGDHDDRVVPLHSHKFLATLQWAQSGDAPVLTRIETATGHGAGKPATLVASEWADLLAFCAHHTGLARLRPERGLEGSGGGLHAQHLPDVTVGVGEAVAVHRAVGHRVQPGSATVGERPRHQVVDLGPTAGGQADDRRRAGVGIGDRTGGEVGEPVADHQHHDDGVRDREAAAVGGGVLGVQGEAQARVEGGRPCQVGDRQVEEDHAGHRGSCRRGSSERWTPRGR